MLILASLVFHKVTGNKVIFVSPAAVLFQTYDEFVKFAPMSPRPVISTAGAAAEEQQVTINFFSYVAS